jgi:protein gp37/ParB-like chromosome segregation protein Spo0J
MTEFGKYKVHPAAAHFPLIKGEEFEQLVAHVKARKLFEAIVLAPDGVTIVDGRNRFRACEAAKIKPRFRTLPKRTTEYDIIEIVIGANMRRRDLSTGQKAMIAQELAPMLEVAAKERMREGGGDQRSVKARKNRRSGGTKSSQALPGRVANQVAKQANVGTTAVKKAKKIKQTSQRLADKVSSGEMTLEDAYKQANKMQPVTKEQKPISKTHVDLRTHLGDVVPYPLPKGKPSFNRTNEQIDWAAWSWNPVTGCLHGCKYCYAREMAELRESYRAIYPVGFTPLFHYERLDAPANTKVPDEARKDHRQKRVFVCSMADLFGKWVPDEWIEKVLAKCQQNQQWEYLFLTKFPRRYVDLKLPQTGWIGTSVPEQKYVRLAEEAFEKIHDVRVKWLSLEPLLEPVQFTDLSMFDWVVIGSQSATDQPKDIERSGHVPEFAPPIEWVARIIDQARECGCKIYCKPNLLGKTDPQSPGMALPQEEPILTNGKISREQVEFELVK